MKSKASVKLSLNNQVLNISFMSPVVVVSSFQSTGSIFISSRNPQIPRCCAFFHWEKFFPFGSHSWFPLSASPPTQTPVQAPDSSRGQKHSNFRIHWRLERNSWAKQVGYIFSLCEWAFASVWVKSELKKVVKKWFEEAILSDTFLFHCSMWVLMKSEP